MNVHRLAAAALLTLAVTGAAQSAHAQTYVTPVVGGAFGGSTDDSKLTFGGNIAFLSDHVLGFAIDAAYTKDFFFESPSGGNNNVTTLMANVVLSTPTGPRLYVSGGAGLLKTRVTNVSGFVDVDHNDFGVNGGAGVYLIGDGSIGLQADIRYFRRLTDPEPDGEFDLAFGDLHFWRGTVGVTFRF